MKMEHLESEILIKTDELITILLELNETNEYKLLERKRYQASELYSEMIPLLSEFLDHKTEYLELILYQLVQERLPETIEFENQLQIRRELAAMFEKTRVVQEKCIQDLRVDKTSKSDSDLNCKSELYYSIAKIFPQFTIISNYRIRGQRLEVFLPEAKLGLVTELGTYALARLQYVCKQEGIKIMNIPAKITKDYRLLTKMLKT